VRRHSDSIIARFLINKHACIAGHDMCLKRQMKPAQLLLASAVVFGAAALSGMPASLVGVKPPGAVSTARQMTAQAALAVASARQRTTVQCGLQGVRDRSRAVSC
jgi:hypothetical protein